MLDKHKGFPSLGKASINLTSIRETDSGWYQCKVYFPNRTPSSLNNGSWFHLAVDGDALLKIPPINQTVMEGDPAIFRYDVFMNEPSQIDFRLTFAFTFRESRANNHKKTKLTKLMNEKLQFVTKN